MTKTISGITVASRSIADDRPDSQLLIQHLILGMLHLIQKMENSKKFCVSTASLLLNRRPLGYIEMFALVPPGPPGRSDSLREDTTPKKLTLDNEQSKGLTARRKIVDPTDPDFAIFVERKGYAMPYDEFLSTILYAMATAAQGQNQEYCQDLAGFNEQGSVTYRIHGKPTTESRHLLSYEMVRTGLKMVATAIHDQNAFGEVELGFSYGGEILGYGRIEFSDFAASTAR